VILVVFLALIVGPIVAGKQIKLDVGDMLPMEILQPTGYNNNNTNAKVTGKCLQEKCPEFQGGAATGDAGGAADTTEGASNKFRRYMAY